MFLCKKIVLVLCMVLSMVAFAIAGVTIQGTPPAKYADGTIDVQRFSDDAERAKLFVVDVRTPKEFEAGHLNGATNLSVVDELEDKLDTLPKDKPVVFMCARGRRAFKAYDLVKTARPDLAPNLLFLDAKVSYANGNAVVTPN